MTLCLFEPKTRSTKQRLPLWLMLLALTGLSACVGADAQSKKPAGKPAVPVVAATAARSTVPILVQTTGTAQAYSTVAVKSQVAGQLTGVYFKEGQTVKQGDLLFTIDARSLESAVSQAEANRNKALAQVNQAKAQVNQAITQVSQAKANVSKESAQARNANAQAQRYSTLVSQGAVSQSQADEFRTAAETQQATVTASESSVGNAEAAVESASANLQNAEAEVGAAEAALETAKVQLSYASIYAPSSGRLGKLNVNQGNLIKENDTNPIVSISQVQPIYVEFVIPQRSLTDLKKYQAQRKLQVEAKAPNDNSPAARGELVFVDSGVDTATGTIKLRASFANNDGRLTPGQFVNVTLRLTEEPNTIVVPTPAIQTGQKGSFVYAIKPDKTVEVRQVTVGQNFNNQTVVRSGLQAGDRVVVDGQFNLAPGVTVQEKEGNNSSQSKPSQTEPAQN